MTLDASPRALRSLDDLVEAGILAPERKSELEAVAARYAISITPAMRALIDPTDAADPIARQFVPEPRELEHKARELADPIGDKRHSPVKASSTVTATACCSRSSTIALSIAASASAARWSAPMGSGP